MLEMGLVSVVVFSLMGSASVIAAILNVDGSFRRPLLAACIFGGFWGCLCLVGVWMILIYLRHELHIDSGNVRHRGGLFSGSVCVSRLTAATWKSFTREGSLTLHESSGSVKVAFGNYTYEERRELIRFFREALVACDQQGWEQFEKRCLPPQVEYRVLQKKNSRSPSLRSDGLCRGNSADVWHPHLAETEWRPAEPQSGRHCGSSAAHRHHAARVHVVCCSRGLIAGKNPG